MGCSTRRDAGLAPHFEQLARAAIVVELPDAEFLCLGLDRLIDVKRAAGRPKDLEVIAELEIIRDELS